MKAARWAALAVIVLLLATGCAEQAAKVNEWRGAIDSAVTEFKEWAGDQVPSIEGVNSRLAESASGVLSSLKELNYELSFRQNGIGFRNAAGVEGVVGIRGNSIVFDAVSPGKEADALHALVRIATVFSEDNLLQERIEAIAGNSGPQTVQISETDWLRTDGNVVEVHFERPLIEL